MHNDDIYLISGLNFLSGVDQNTISFAESMTISNIGQVRDEILAAFEQQQSLVLEIDAITETDLTFVQLIESARRKAGETGRNLTLRHPAAGAMLEVLQRGGFLDDEHSDRAQFWLQGTAQ